MLIYDVGMAEGDDTIYYLKKGARVVAIEANPEVCEFTRQKFHDAIESKQLIILNLAVGESDAESVTFFINDKHLRGSSLARPANPQARQVQVPLRRLSALFDEYGEPDFVKIDVENYDHVILRELRKSGRIPKHLSAEAHNFAVIEELIRCEFQQFRMVNAAISHKRFRSHPIEGPQGRQAYSFPPHSSGPFGADLPDPWVNSEKMVANWLLRHSLHGRGWYDIHAVRSP
jgi:FkbM family methyltransferase